MHILRFDSLESWIKTAASLWRDRLRAQPRLRTCLTSGHTPNPLYDAMVASHRQDLVSFRDSELFALDEFGGLAPDDPGRCSNMLRHYLVDHIDLPPAVSRLRSRRPRPRPGLSRFRPRHRLPASISRSWALA